MKIQIIVGSTREQRQTHKLAKWVHNSTAKLEGVESEVVDLIDYPLPLFDEAISPQYNPNRTPSASAQKLLEKLAQADAYVLVSPEYNRSTSGVLKNMFDYLDFQMERKPVGLVAHGSTGGAQAISHLRGIVTGVLAITVPQAVYFSHRVGEVMNEQGELSGEPAAHPGGPGQALDAMLSSLKWYGDALKAAQ